MKIFTLKWFVRCSFTFCSLGLCLIARAAEVSLTFDDFDVSDAVMLNAEERNNRILGVLNQHGQLKTTLFVQGKYVDSERGQSLLKEWDEKSHIIGNHTYSHLSYSSPKVDFSHFSLDLLKTESLIHLYSHFQKLFRFPYLHEGDTAEKRDSLRQFLKENHYKIGHVTIDASDWYVDARMKARILENPKASLEPYRDYYLHHIWDRAQFYNDLSKKVLGREVKHTLLLHYNLLNALFLKDLIAMFDSRGWTVISSKDAFEDPVFMKEPKIVPAGNSIIWALAKETGRFDSILREGPGEDAERFGERVFLGDRKDMIQFVSELSADVDDFIKKTPSTLPDSSLLIIDRRLVELEKFHGGRIGLSAFDVKSSGKLEYRADERFPLCSTFKAFLTASVLKKSMSEPDLLEERIRFDQNDVDASGYGPITKDHVKHGMTIGELCKATLQHSDNAAANLLMKKMGGPPAVTSFLRSIGDTIFRLDRWEPDLNSAIPGDDRDTSTPRAIEQSLRHLILSSELGPAQRAQLIAWLKGNTTGGARIRSGIPHGWTVGDKTGTGSYGSTNDIGIAWSPEGDPIVLAIYYTQTKEKAEANNEVIAAITRIVLEGLLRQNSDESKPPRVSFLKISPISNKAVRKKS